MPAVTITTSPNVASLDSNILMDLCAGQIYADLTPTIYIGSGADNVLGAKIQITNPNGVVIRAYPSDYDMSPALSGQMDIVIPFPVPTQANNFQYGKYVISAQLTDQDGTKYVVTKSVSICAPDQANKTRNYGTISAKLSGVCRDGKVYVLVDNEPNYKGFSVESAVRTFVLDYPTGSGKTSESTIQPSFTVQLYEGVYKVSGTSCAFYDYGDHVAVKVNYKLSYSKPILCSLDDCCVFTGLAALNSRLDSDCSDIERKNTEDRIKRVGLLLNTIDFASRCGDDVSEYISQLEDALGQSCSCNFNDGTPIINNDPADDILIQGCNVESETVGLTKIYTINAYTYLATFTSNGGAFTITDVVVNGCVQSQNYVFSISAVYSQIKGLADSNDTESSFWASVIKKQLDTLDLTCYGIDSDTLIAMTFEELIQAIATQACAGGTCIATVDTTLASQFGGNVTLSWSATNNYSTDIYVDGIFIASALAFVTSYSLNGYADGDTHTYRIVSKCSNGVYGTAKQATFGFIGCPSISSPNVSNINVTNAVCPFDLTGLISSLPAGIVAEWHTANNTLATTLVPDETSVSDGVFYAFATDSNGCYSTGVKVIVTCSVSSSCTAPQLLSINAIIGGLKVSFSSPAFPPPGNSYTIKRKPAGDPDIDGSYVTIGSPSFNISTSKWEKVDSTAVNNTLYTYKAQSNCGATTPYTTTDFANITCPALTLTSNENQIGYSFTDTGGEIDQYRVELWDNSGETRIDFDTFTPVFSNPMTGTFDYLTTGTNYKVRVVPYIGTDSFPCAFVNRITSQPLFVAIGRTGSFSGTLFADVDGGTPPYTYLFTCVATGGACEAHTISTPTAATSSYTATAYAGVTYQFSLTVHDSLGASGTADAVPILPCLVPETMILMKDNSEKQLGDLKVGDELFGENKVESFEEFNVPVLYVINGGLLRASEGHIHIVKNRDEEELVQSAALTIWDGLIDKDGERVSIKSIDILHGTFTVINIKTTTKEYIANGIRTHNKLACP